MDAEYFVGQTEARQVLHLRTQWAVRHLISRRILEPCVHGDLNSPESVGVTRASVEAEAEWWRRAGRTQKVIRRLTGPLNYI